LGELLPIAGAELKMWKAKEIDEDDTEELERNHCISPDYSNGFLSGRLQG
jgi:hypothetical protein